MAKKTKKIGRPAHKGKDVKKNYTFRIRDIDRMLLTVEFGSMSQALEYLIDLARKK